MNDADDIEFYADCALGLHGVKPRVEAVLLVEKLETSDSDRDRLDAVAILAAVARKVEANATS